MSRLKTTLSVCGAAMLLLVPAIFNRSPFIFYDTSHYLELGRAILAHASSHLPTTAGSTGAAGSAATGPLPERDHAALSYAGGRSPYYSVFLYGLVQAGGLWAAATAQALICAAALHLSVRAAGLAKPVMTTFGLAALLGLFSTAGFYAAMLMPDVFVAIGLICLGLLVSGFGRSSPLTTAAVFLTGAAAVSTHATNAPVLLAAGLAFAGVMWEAFGSRVVAVARPWALGLGMITCGMAAVSAFNLASRAVLHDAPRSPPYLTARVMADGYGRAYLREACRRPGVYALCAYKDRRFRTQDEFLWSADPSQGVFTAVSSLERRRLQNEQVRFVVAAVLNSPRDALSASLDHIVRQLSSFGVRMEFDQTALSWETMAFNQVTPRAAPEVRRSLAYRHAFPFAAVDVVALLTLAAALITFGWRLSRPPVRAALTRSRLRRQPDTPGVLAALLAALLAAVAFNAALTGAFSGVNPRYEARLIWLIPLLVFLFLGATTRSRLRALALEGHGDEAEV